MGSPVAPVLAELYLRKLEKTVLSENFRVPIKLYYRYVDDIFLVTSDSTPDSTILQEMNAIDNNIKFTLEPSEADKLNYLDVTVIRKQEQLLTKWYKKKSSPLIFNRYNSYGAEKYKISLIYCMIQRIQKIVSPEYIKDDLTKLKKAFENSGYPDSVLRKHFRTNTKIRINPRTQDHLPKKIIYIGLTYVGKNSDVFSKRIKKICSNAFPSIKVRQFYKSAPNFLGAFVSQYKPKCSSTAIGVYRIKCKECSKVYIGETGRSFKLRTGEHKNNCKHYITGKSAIADPWSAPWTKIW